MPADNPNRTLDRVLLALAGIVVLVIALKFASGALFGQGPGDDCTRNNAELASNENCAPARP